MLSGPFLATQSFPFSVVTVRAQAISIVSAWTSDLGALMHILYVKKHLNIRLQAPTNSPPHDLDGSSPISNIGESANGPSVVDTRTASAGQMVEPQSCRGRNLELRRARLAIAVSTARCGRDWPRHRRLGPMFGRRVTGAPHTQAGLGAPTAVGQVTPGQQAGEPLSRCRQRACWYTAAAACGHPRQAGYCYQYRPQGGIVSKPRSPLGSAEVDHWRFSSSDQPGWPFIIFIYNFV